jgi:PEP-CTERM/exosortase A-associated glycosyltransferase
VLKSVGFAIDRRQDVAYPLTKWSRRPLHGRLRRRLRRLLSAFLVRPAKAARYLVDAGPKPIRAPVARLIAPIALALARRRIAATSSAALAVRALVVANREAAGRTAIRLASSARTNPATRRQLARLAIQLREREIAGRIIETLAFDSSPATLSVRARHAQAVGRYREALELGRAAEALGVRDGRRVAARAQETLDVLRPTWRPDLDGADARLRHLRGSTRRGRILHLLFASLPYRQSGYAMRSHAVGRCQRGAGLDPHLVTRSGFPATDDMKAAASRETLDGLPYYRLLPFDRSSGVLSAAAQATARAAAPLVEELRPAAFQAASNHLQATAALALAEPLGVPVVYEVRGFWEETWAANPWHTEEAARTTDHYRLSREAEMSAMQRADRIVTLSETMLQELVGRGCRPERIVVIPNAVDVEMFEPRPRDPALASELGIEPDDAVVGYVSSLNAYEGIPYLLEAIATLRARGRRVRLLLVGDGQEEASLRQLVRTLRLGDGTVIMPGRVEHSQVPRYYSLLDVFVVPRSGDRVSQLVTPLKPYEAMSMERAVVVSDVAALREIVTPGETGVTFRPEDGADLADVLEALLDDPGERGRLGRQAREWVLGHRTWAANGLLYRGLYEELGAA